MITKRQAAHLNTLIADYASKQAACEWEQDQGWYSLTSPAEAKAECEQAKAKLDSYIARITE